MADTNETAVATAAPKKRRTKAELEAAGIEKKATKRVVFYKATDSAGNEIADVKIDFLKFMTMRDGLGEFVKLQGEFGPAVKFQEFEL